MIKASNEFVSFVKKGVNFVNYADVTLTSGEVLNLGPSDFYTDGFDLIDKTSNSDFGFGHALGKEVTIKISNRNDKFSMHDFFGAVIFMYVAVIKPDGTVLSERKGKYYVLEPATPGEVISFSAVDSMSRFDKDYNSNTVYPATLKTIMVDCCLDCGVNMGFDDFPNSDYVVKSKPTDCTYRQVVSWVAQIAGMNLRVNHNDLLEFVWYDFEGMSLDILDGGNYLYTDNDVIDGGDFETYEGYVWDGGNFTDNTPRNVLKINSLSVSTDDVIITGIKIEKEDQKWQAGTGEYVLSISNNELLQDNEQEILDYLTEKMVGLTFRPLTCDIANNPLWEPLDACYVYDRKGNGYFTLINSVRYKINGFTTLSCNAKDPVRNGNTYTSESAKAVVQAKRNTEKQISTYDNAVQNMNLLAANSMGLFRDSETLEDGSTIYYMSNRPIVKNENGMCEFELDSVVYKMTGDGFFVSEDGGVTYTLGMDADGNAIVNVLSAIGITFDWARGGTLTLGGDNDINGSLVVYDANGTVVGKFNKDGLWAENGYFKGRIESEDANITGGIINIETSTNNRSSIVLKGESNAIYMKPLGISFHSNYDYGTQIRDEYIRIGSVDSRYTLVDDEKIFIKGSGTGTAITITSNSYTQLTGSFSFNGSSISVNTNNLKLHTDTAYTYNMETSKGIKIGGDSVFEKNVTINGSCKFGNTSYDTVGFFGNIGSIKKSVSKITTPSTATTTTNANKINEIISALQDYNLL